MENIPLSIAVRVQERWSHQQNIYIYHSNSNRVRDKKEILPAKLITCRFPVMIQPMLANQLDEYSMYHVQSSHTPIMVKLKLNGTLVLPF